MRALFTRHEHDIGPAFLADCQRSTVRAVEIEFIQMFTLQAETYVLKIDIARVFQNESSALLALDLQGSVEEPFRSQVSRGDGSRRNRWRRRRWQRSNRLSWKRDFDNTGAFKANALKSAYTLKGSRDSTYARRMKRHHRSTASPWCDAAIR